MMPNGSWHLALDSRKRPNGRGVPLAAMAPELYLGVPFEIYSCAAANDNFAPWEEACALMDNTKLRSARSSTTGGRHNMNTTFIFEALKAHLKARGLTYRHLADALTLSEPSVKRIFASGDCSLARVNEICHFLQLDLGDILKNAPRHRRLIESLSWEQEIELASTCKLLVMAICVLNLWRFEDMRQRLNISPEECITLLARLDKIGFLELFPDNQYRLLIARNFSWIADGPIMRLLKSMSPDFFNHPFNGHGEFFRMVSTRISPKARDELQARLEKIAQEYADQVAVDSCLPLDERPPLSLCIAVRTWVPEQLREYFRTPEALLVEASKTVIRMPVPGLEIG